MDAQHEALRLVFRSMARGSCGDFGAFLAVRTVCRSWNAVASLVAAESSPRLVAHMCGPVGGWTVDTSQHGGAPPLKWFIVRVGADRLCEFSRSHARRAPKGASPPSFSVELECLDATGRRITTERGDNLVLKSRLLSCPPSLVASAGPSISGPPRSDSVCLVRLPPGACGVVWWLAAVFAGPGLRCFTTFYDSNYGANFSCSWVTDR
jgi:hypothetical protein